MWHDGKMQRIVAAVGKPDSPFQLATANASQLQSVDLVVIQPISNSRIQRFHGYTPRSIRGT